jgi:uncharacterized membrane protein
MPDAFERRLGLVLGLGVRASALLLGAGLVLFLVGRTPAMADALLRAGLIALMSTPVLRVALSVVEYARVRDWFFLATATAVLLVLLATIATALLQLHVVP